MGHERIGVLPRTTRWRNIVDDLARYSRNNASAQDLSKHTLENVRSRFNYIAADSGVNAAFSFLLSMAYNSKAGSPKTVKSKPVLNISPDSNQIQVAKEINKWVESNMDSREYGEIAKGAAIDAVQEWYEKLLTGQEDLFGKATTNREVWHKASDGSGFCELSRLFFSRFTERYINYFLEREASSKFSSIDDRERLKSEIQNHIVDVSKFAFETSKITESFAAGWYNKHTKEGLPKNKDIQGFLWLSFEKIREELRREDIQQ